MDFEIVNKLFEIPAVAGNEQLLKGYIKDIINDYCDKIYEDNFGNLIAEKGSFGKRIMINASISSDGVFVTDVKENGIIKFSPIGKFEPELNIFRKYSDESGNIGVMFPENKSDGKPEAEDMAIDFSGSDKIKNGDVLYPVSENTVDSKKICACYAGRIAAIYILISLIKKINAKNNTYIFVFSVQDNLGFKGARIAATTVNPDMGYIIGESDCDNKLTEIKAGGGPVIRIMDKGVIFDKKHRDELTSRLSPCDFQSEILISDFATNNGILYLNNGIPAININCPVKFYGSFCETVYISDIEKIINLFKTED